MQHRLAGIEYERFVEMRSQGSRFRGHHVSQFHGHLFWWWFMDLALYAVQAVLKEKRSRREVALAIGRSKSWVAKMVLAYQASGEAGLVPAKRGPKGPVVTRTACGVEDTIVRMRKALDEDGLDAGASTIRYHLLRQSGSSPSRATIHRILVARGFVTPRPQKRPRSSWIRFEASLANETWQTDYCEWTLAGGETASIITFIDDYSRMLMTLVAVDGPTGEHAIAALSKAAACSGFQHRSCPTTGLLLRAPTVVASTGSRSNC